MKYNNFQIDKILQSMFVLVDTREQNTPLFRQRVKQFECDYERKKLDYGDYSVGYIDLEGNKIYLDKYFAVERKMNLDELCNCFTSGRSRFEKEFKRAKEAGAKIHLLVEEANYEKILNGAYRSRMQPNALLASYLAWAERYGIQLHFCHKETTPKLIKKILYYSLKIFLEKENE